MSEKRISFRDEIKLKNQQQKEEGKPINRKSQGAIAPWLFFYFVNG